VEELPKGETDGKSEVTITDNDHEGTRRTLPPDDDAPAPGPLDEIKKGLKIVANLGVTLGSSIDRMTRSHDRLMNALQRNTPVDYGIGVAGVYPAAGNLVLNFGTPDQGFMWEIESIVLGGTDVNVTAIGSVGVYVSGVLPPPGGSAPGGITSLADRSTALPNVAFYGRRDLIVNDQEYLFAVIFGGAVGQTYGGNMSATVFPVDAGRGKDVVTL
jgi:hypothetical protein